MAKNKDGAGDTETVQTCNSLRYKRAIFGFRETSPSAGHAVFHSVPMTSLPTLVALDIDILRVAHGR